MNLHNYSITFGVPILVQATDEADALKAAATLIWADSRYYATQVLRWEGPTEVPEQQPPEAT